MAGISVLCVDPDESTREKLEEAVRTDLEEMDPIVEGRSSVETAGEFIDDGEVDCLVTEYDLPDGTGLDLAGRIRASAPDAGVVPFTDRPPEEIDAAEDIVTEYVDKGADAADTRVTSLIRMTVSSRSQVSYPLPETEAERLAALESYDFDSDDLGRSFDRLTDLATRHFDVELASLNLIEEHDQRLLACQGMGADSMSTPRDASICTFTILSDDRVMTVEDVREDPRFEGRAEEFEALGIRSYMGARLLTPAGFSIGTLCVYEDEPRQFSSAERDYLRTLADLAVDLLVARADPDGERTVVTNHRRASGTGRCSPATDDSNPSHGGRCDSSLPRRRRVATTTISPCRPAGRSRRPAVPSSRW